MNAVYVLAYREILRFWRQPTRLFGSLVQPLLFWWFMGAGFGDSFRPDAGPMSYGEFFYPGIVLMLVLFAAIFSTITLIEDRNAGFLQGVLVAPVPRVGIVLGKLAGGTAIAMIQALAFLIFSPLAGLELSVGLVLRLMGLFCLIGIGFTGLGFMVAWAVESTAGYHAIMSVFMLPLWMLSGALFPLDGAATWLAWIMRLNPVTYALVLVRQAFYNPFSALVQNADFIQALWVTCVWAGVSIVGSVWMMQRKV